MKYKVLITGKLHDQAIASFKEAENMEITYEIDCPRQKIEAIICDYHVLVTRSETNIDKALLEMATNLKIIGRAAVGVGNIDISYATEKGVLVINCPGKNTNSAAELTMGLLLSLFRKIPNAHKTIKSGGWDRHRFSGYELRGKKIGIVGLGNVGHRVAQFARGFDMEVYAYDPYIAPVVFERNHCKPCSSLEDIATKVNILSFHVPLNDETYGMCDQEILNSMAKGSYVLNAARGGIINENDLVASLESGHISGAGIDTFENEPTPLKELIEHENVYATPHIGATTEEAQHSIGMTIFNQVYKAVGGGVVDYPVNLPEVGTIDSPVLKTYAVLAEKLGSLTAQIIDFNPQRVLLNYRGTLASLDQSLIKLAWLKGYLSHTSNDYISFVNALSHAEKVGLEIHEEIDESFNAYNSALKVQISSGQDHNLSVGGTVFDEKVPRLSLINDYYFEVEPEGTFVLIENLDKVGVVGKVGTFLAEKNINIHSFNLARNKKGGKAMSLIRIDSRINQKDVDGLEKIENILVAKDVYL